MQLLPPALPTERKYSTLEIFRELYGVPAAKSGQSVNWASAFQVAAVLACVRVIAEGIAQVPLKVFRDTEGGGREPATNHPLFRLLHRRPNEWQTSFEFREQIALHVVMCGNAFVFKNEVRGSIRELLPFEPGVVTVHQGNNGPENYEIRLKSGGKEVIPAAKIWHLRGPSWNGWLGMEPVKLAREAIGLAMAAEEHVARTMSNGARLAGVLKHPKTLSDEAEKRLRDSWQAQYGGSANAGKTAVLEEGMDFVQLSMNSVDLQLAELRKQQLEEIARAFRVFPAMIGYSDKASTYASVEQFFLAHVVHTLGPWYERIEQSIDANLIDYDREPGLFAKFIVTGLLRGDAKTRSAYYGSGIKDGWMTRNEARALEDMNPLEGLDVPLMPLNMADGTEPAPPPGQEGAENAPA